MDSKYQLGEPTCQTWYVNIVSLYLSDPIHISQWLVQLQFTYILPPYKVSIWLKIAMIISYFIRGFYLISLEINWNFGTHEQHWVPEKQKQLFHTSHVHQWLNVHIDIFTYFHLILSSPIDWEWEIEEGRVGFPSPNDPV